MRDYVTGVPHLQEHPDDSYTRAYDYIIGRHSVDIESMPDGSTIRCDSRYAG